jgi:ABC-type dipeptide/oligopeptide/nickel transport system permease component
MAGLLGYLLRRVLFAIPVFLTVSIITFLATYAAGDPVQTVLFFVKNKTPETIAALNAQFHMGEPIYTRYFLWLSDFLHGNLGQSLYAGTVASKILPWTGTTLELQVPALLLSLALGIPLGVFSAKRQYTKSDVAVTTTAIFGISMPTFWLGIIAIIIFSLDLHWLPSFGAISAFPPYWWGSVPLDQIAHAILPLSVLTLVSLATYVRLIRANMLDALRQDFVLGARASGLSDFNVTYKHALKNAITPVITIVGLTFGSLLGGAPALEYTFSWPGLGNEFVIAATSLDLPVVQAITMIITIMVLVANIGLDLVYALLDPRVKIS